MDLITLYHLSLQLLCALCMIIVLVYNYLLPHMTIHEHYEGHADCNLHCRR